MDKPAGYALFDTDIGVCGLAWTQAGISRVQLPESDTSATEARLARMADAGPPGPRVRAAITALERYFIGETVDFTGIDLDLGAVSPFERAVYDIARRTGWGAVTTYGAIAAELGGPALARAVGRALGANPVPIIVPCHRVLAARGELGGFSAHGGRILKQWLLELERAPVQLALF